MDQLPQRRSAALCKGTEPAPYQRVLKCREERLEDGRLEQARRLSVGDQNLARLKVAGDCQRDNVRPRDVTIDC
jgi:hypothetical protein